MPPTSWFNGSATEMRAFLAALIDEDFITDLEDVVKFCDRPQNYNELRKYWDENDGELPEGEDDDEDNDDDDDDDAPTE
jgi:hypothetical protein